MHGKFVLHPFLDRRIPIITDGEAVDMTFGTTLHAAGNGRVLQHTVRLAR